MTSYVPPLKNGAFICYVGLVDSANRPYFKVNPTLATGDFQVSIDGGAFANLATLPTVTPAGGRIVKISLAAGEMNGDNIVVQCVDAAGSEWDDVLVTLQTTARQIDDLAFPATSGRSIAVDAAGLVSLAQPYSRLIRSGTAQQGVNPSVIQLDVGASSVFAFYNGMLLYIYAGTGAGQARRIVTYLNKYVTFDTPLIVEADATSQFAIFADEGPQIDANGNITVGSIDSGATAAIAAAVAALVQDGYTWTQILGIIGAAVAGKVSGAPSATIFRSLNDTANRISSVNTSDGNRTSVTLNP